MRRPRSQEERHIRFISDMAAEWTADMTKRSKSWTLARFSFLDVCRARTTLRQGCASTPPGFTNHITGISALPAAITNGCDASK